MASVSVSHVILFIAAVGVAAVVASTATGVGNDVADAIRDAGTDLGDELDTDFSIISDPGSNAIYNNSSTTVTLLVKNTGSRVLPTDPELLDVLVDGRLVEESNVTVVDGEFWRPGNVARITLNTTLSTGPHRVVVRADERRSFLLFSYYGETEMTSTVVFSGSIKIYDADTRTVTTYLGDTVPDGLGPGYDFDGDGGLDVPFVNSTGALKVVYSDGSVRTIAGQPYEGSATRLAVGTWNGSAPSIFFGNTSGVYRVTPGKAPVRLTTTSTVSVAGIADFDADDGRELLFIGESSQNVWYLDGDGTVVNTGSNVKSGTMVGRPADFDGDGKARLPYVDGSNNIRLFGRNGKTSQLNGSTKAEKDFIGSYDVDSDDRPEIVYVEYASSSEAPSHLRYMNFDGTNEPLLNSSGERVSVDTGTSIGVV